MHPRELLAGLKEIMYFKCLIQHPAHRKHSINDRYDFNNHYHCQQSSCCHFQNTHPHVSKRDINIFLNVYCKHCTLLMLFLPYYIPKVRFYSLSFTSGKISPQDVKQLIQSHTGRETEGPQISLAVKSKLSTVACSLFEIPSLRGKNASFLQRGDNF